MNRNIYMLKNTYIDLTAHSLQVKVKIQDFFVQNNYFCQILVQNLFKCVRQHFSFARIIHPPDGCGTSRWWLNSMIVAQVYLGMVTINCHSKMCSFNQTTHCHTCCKFQVHQICCPWIKCSFQYNKPSSVLFLRIWQYIQKFETYCKDLCTMLKTCLFLHKLHTHQICHPSNMFAVLWIKAYPCQYPGTSYIYWGGLEQHATGHNHNLRSSFWKKIWPNKKQRKQNKTKKKQTKKETYKPDHVKFTL